MELEKLIAYHCGPALSGIKPANIFSCSGKFCLYTAAVHLNKRCNPFGVYFLPVCRSNGATLLFVYNKNLLESVLQDKTVSRVGDNKEIPINVRLICATNMNLQNILMYIYLLLIQLIRINIFLMYFITSK